jgi:hypothetical protein
VLRLASHLHGHDRRLRRTSRPRAAPFWKASERRERDLLGPRTRAQAVEKEQVNGKFIARKLYRCAAPPLKGWQHATELWRVAKETRHSDGTISSENRYFITSLPASRLTDRQVLKAVRLHWSIENNANWVLDTAWQEDSHPWCNRARQLLSLLRIIAYNAIARFKYGPFSRPNAIGLTWAQALHLARVVLFPPAHAVFPLWV